MNLDANFFKFWISVGNKTRTEYLRVNFDSGVGYGYPARAVSTLTEQSPGSDPEPTLSQKVSSTLSTFRTAYRRCYRSDSLIRLYDMELSSLSRSFGGVSKHLLRSHSAAGGFGGGDEILKIWPKVPEPAPWKIYPGANWEGARFEVEYDLKDLRVHISQEVRDKLVRMRMESMCSGVIDNDQVGSIRRRYRADLAGWKRRVSWREVEINVSWMVGRLPKDYESLKLWVSSLNNAVPQVPVGPILQAIKLEYPTIRAKLDAIGTQWGVGDKIAALVNKMPGSVLLSLLEGDFPTSQDIVVTITDDLSFLVSRIQGYEVSRACASGRVRSFFDYVALSISVYKQVVDQLNEGEMGNLLYV